MSFCENCGAKIEEGSVFCAQCGTKIDYSEQETSTAVESEKNEVKPKSKRKPRSEQPKEEEEQQEQPIAVGGSGNIYLCQDGKYRWVYEFSMLKNPTLLFTIWKVLALAAVAPALVSSLSVLFRKGPVRAAMVFGQIYPVVLAIMLVLGVLGYFIVAGMYGWKYIVQFVMSEDGIVHIQKEKQFKKAQGIAWVLAAAAVKTKSPGRVGQALMVGTKNTMSSEFKSVKTIIGIRRRNTIKVNELFGHNQIYVEKADYDFVWDYITSRCPNAKIK